MILNSKELIKLRSRIALDIGNVLVHIDMDIFINELFICGIPLKEAENFCITTQAFFDNGILDMEKALYLKFPNLDSHKVKRIKDAWLAVVSPCEATLEVLTELLSEGAEVALLSNIGRDHASYLSEMCSGQFDRCIKHFSCDVGASKPTKLFYQSFLNDYPYFGDKELYKIDRFGFASMSRGLFLDDKLENIEGARKYLDAKIFDISKHTSDEDAANEMIRLIRDI